MKRCVILCLLVLAPVSGALALSIGQTLEQVNQELGTSIGYSGPESHRVYIYRAAAVTFRNGRVVSWKYKGGKAPSVPAPVPRPTPAPRAQPAIPVVAPGDASYDSVKRCLFLVRTDRGAGSGFLVQMGSRRYVMTNAHVILGAKKVTLLGIDGAEIAWRHLEVAYSTDLARFDLQSVDTARPVLRFSPGLPSLNTPITVYGNSQGQGVITELKGKVVGVGANQVEIDAGFVEGNSGSPALDDEANVVGVATFVARSLPGKDWITSGTRFQNARRFCVRPAADERWSPASLAFLARQSQALEDIHALVDAHRVVLGAIFGGKTPPAAVTPPPERLFHNPEIGRKLTEFCETYNEVMALRADFSSYDQLKAKYPTSGARKKATEDYSSALKRMNRLLSSTTDSVKTAIRRMSWSSASLSQTADSYLVFVKAMDEAVTAIQKNPGWQGLALTDKEERLLRTIR